MHEREKAAFSYGKTSFGKGPGVNSVAKQKNLQAPVAPGKAVKGKA